MPIENEVCLTTAPEICVEVLSPSNSKAEIAEETRLYFESGAEEGWVCDAQGAMVFFSESENPGEANPAVVPIFPV